MCGFTDRQRYRIQNSVDIGRKSKKIFDVDSKNDTIGFFDTPVETDARHKPTSYGRRIGDNITMQLEAARGRCPEPHHENIEYIIKNVQYF